MKQTRKLTDDQLEVLIKWKDLPNHDSTWEGYKVINELFPDFHLEDKVALLGEGIDGPTHGPKLKVYARRKRGTCGSKVVDEGNDENMQNNQL